MKDFFNKYITTEFKLNKYQFLGILGLIVVISGIFGWVYEFIFYFFNGGMEKFYLQGGNFLPWINIYAIGAIMILLLAFRFRKNPFIVFLISFISTGILEYFSGLVIYEVFNTRFWNYNIEILNFGNINGYVCLRSVLFFGISGLILTYLIVPLCYFISTRISIKKFVVISVILFSVVVLDELYNLAFARLFNLPTAPEIYKSIGFEYVDANEDSQ